MSSADKIKYIRQRDKSSCGPVALINILKWLGCNVTYDFIHIARWACEWEDGRSESGGGTSSEDLDRALKYFGIKRKKRFNTSLRELDDHLDNGGIILIGYSFLIGKTKAASHFSVCVGKTNNHYVMVNDHNKKTIIKRSRKSIKKYITYRPPNWANLEPVTWVWLISKSKCKNINEQIDKHCEKEN